METVPAIVIGAGVVGLACARALARRGIPPLILEQHGAFGQETSARNSEVIHSGIYYPPGSLKAQLCVQGRELLYDFCASHGIGHRRCGKLIVATDREGERRLEQLHAQGLANGVTDLERLSGPEAQALEPALHCTAALLCPSTGIVDSHGLMLALLGEGETGGATLVCHSPVLGGNWDGTRLALQVGEEGGQGATMALAGELVINAAGLQATQVARAWRGVPGPLPTPHYAKGNYYSLSGRPPFSHLIYPLPEPGGLGVHLTLDLGGQARFGPDVEWLPGADPGHLDYGVAPERAQSFYGEVRKYWPGLAEGALQPAYSGVRPKIAAPGAWADFQLQGPAHHGVPGLVNLFGIESPGLTASLALGEAVCQTLGV